jgi:chorismate dehydratase
VTLDVSSKTSVALAKIIFREFLQIEPIYKPTKPNLAAMLAASDCALLIGDPALIIDKIKYRKFDLAEVWKKFTNCGFVFAMWMANAENAEIAKQINFQKARDEGLTHLDEIVANYETEIPFGREDFRNYLAENISYSIDDSMQKGLKLFFELARKNHLINDCKPLAFIA